MESKSDSPPRPEDRPLHRAECTPRERNSALAAMLLAVALALLVLPRAIERGPQRIAGDAAAAAAIDHEIVGPGIGDGQGSGVGPGAGSGSGEVGTGPGSGPSGDGRADSGPPQPIPPAISAGGGNAADPPAPTAATAEPPTTFGFTPPQEPAGQPLPTAPDPAVGTPSAGSSGSAGGGGTGANFMGLRADARRIVYVIDRSSSMRGKRFAHTTLELKRSIESLDDKAFFSIVFFSSGDPLTGERSFTPMPPGRLMRATPANKRDAVRWLDSIGPSGGTDPTDALAEALRMGPEAIFLMTDGVFDSNAAVEDMLAARNRDRKVAVHTIAFHDIEGEPVLKRIASGHRGSYRFVKDSTGP